MWFSWLLPQSLLEPLTVFDTFKKIDYVIYVDFVQFKIINCLNTPFFVYSTVFRNVTFEAATRVSRKRLHVWPPGGARVWAECAHDASLKDSVELCPIESFAFVREAKTSAASRQPARLACLVLQHDPPTLTQPTTTDAITQPNLRAPH